MKKLTLVTFLLGILVFSSSALASPTINEIKFRPSSEIWIEEALGIEVNCTNGLKVNATLIGESGSTIYIENFTYNPTNSLFTTKIDPTYWGGQPNVFRTIISCLDEFNNIAQNETRFSVSSLNVKISGIHPSTIYLGDVVEVDILVERNDEPINSTDVKFKIIVDNNEIEQPEVRLYDPSVGWKIFFNSSKIQNPIGTHNLQITVFYGRVNLTKTASFTINETIQFSIVNVDKTWVKPNETINLKIQAFEKGNIIQLTSENLVIKIGNTQATIVAISPLANFFSVTILAPSLSPDRYSLTAFLSHKNYTYTSSSTIYYIVQITGKFVDENDKGIPTRISFFSDGVEKLRIYTDASGSYSGNLSPGTYDIEFVFPHSTLRLYEAEISNFEDPVKYYYFDSIELEGLNVASLFVYETDLNYYKASIEMKYDERNVLDENLLKVYKCENWNSGRKECYGKWNEIPASVDKMRNTVYVNTTSLSAYAIGTLGKLSIDFNLNKQIFYLKDLVKVRGMVVDEYRNPVKNASVNIQVKNTSIKQKVFSDSNGLFTIEFLSPDQEGNYSLILVAEKHPYISFNSTLTLGVVKRKEISIVFPDTIRVNQGENFTQEFSVINIGQAELYNLSISLEEIPSNYYKLQEKIEKLEVGEEKKLQIEFFIPVNASAGTSSGKIKVFNEEVSKEKLFGFTIIERNETREAKTMPVGFFGRISLPQISQNYAYLLLFAAISFSLAFSLKKRKIKSQSREEIKNSLLDIKEFLEERKNRAQSMETQPSEEILEANEKGVG
ncbi:MAG: carboxypeptidase-like regulatory domain-containing protein [Candidatus Aenigmatarchaeota archaeon]